MTRGQATVGACTCGSRVQPTVSSPTAPSLYVNPCPFKRREQASPSPLSFRASRESYLTTPPPCPFERREKAISRPRPLSFRASRESYLTTPPPCPFERREQAISRPRPLCPFERREQAISRPRPLCHFERREKSISRHCHTTVKDVSLRSPCQGSGWHAALTSL